MTPAIVDNLAMQRRELWIDLEGHRVIYGWCAAQALKQFSLAPYWHPEVPFGNYRFV